MARARGEAGAFLVSEPSILRLPQPTWRVQPVASCLNPRANRLAIAERQAARLGEQMKRKGLCSDTNHTRGRVCWLTLRLTQWHNGQAVTGRGRGRRYCLAVCWRAVTAFNGLPIPSGDTIELSEFYGRGACRIYAFPCLIHG